MHVLLKSDSGTYGFVGPTPDWVNEQTTFCLTLREERPDADPADYQAWAGGAQLSRASFVSRGSIVEVEWEWHPEFFAGEFNFQISYGDAPIWPSGDDPGSALVRTPVYKLTVADYEAMLADLARWSTGWLAPAPGRVAGRAVTQVSDSRVGALEYLFRHWQSIEHLVDALLQRPKRVLGRRSVSVPLHEVRQFGPEEWAHTAVGGADWTEHQGPLPEGLLRLREKAGGLLPELAVQQRVQLSLNTLENRLVAAILGHFRSELESTLTELARYSAGESPGRASIIDRQQVRIRSIHRRLSSWLRSTWLSDVEPASRAALPSPAMLMHPVYGSLWRHYLQWRRAVTLEDGGDRSLPVERTHQLYEFWCFLTIARELAMTLGVDPDLVVAPVLERTGGGIRLKLHRDALFEIELPGARLSYQRRFRYDSARLRSVSHEMRPDMTVEVNRGGTKQLLVLDPKYRVGHEGLVDGLGSLHTYRDAIVGSEGERAVVGAFMLCPAPPAQPSDHRYLAEEYQANWGLGICVLKPGESSVSLRSLLRTVATENPVASE